MRSDLGWVPVQKSSSRGSGYLDYSNSSRSSLNGDKINGSNRKRYDAINSSSDSNHGGSDSSGKYCSVDEAVQHSLNQALASLNLKLDLDPDLDLDLNLAMNQHKKKTSHLMNNSEQMRINIGTDTNTDTDPHNGRPDKCKGVGSEEMMSSMTHISAEERDLWLGDRQGQRQGEGPGQEEGVGGVGVDECTQLEREIQEERAKEDERGSKREREREREEERGREMEKEKARENERSSEEHHTLGYAFRKAGKRVNDSEEN